MFDSLQKTQETRAGKHPGKEMLLTAYNSFDILCMATTPLGYTTRYLYDRMIDLVGLVRPNHYAPDSANELKERYIYDAFHQRVALRDCGGAVYAVHRDEEGNIIKEINPNTYDKTTNDRAGIEYTYDAYDRNIMTLYPNGGIKRRWYDSVGNIIKVCNPLQYDKDKDDGEGYTYEYDCMGRLIQITAPDGVVVRRYVYDLHGNLIKAIDARSIKIGNTDEERIGRLYTYNYDVNGTLCSKTDRNGTETKYTYNIYNNLMECRQGEQNL